MSLLVLVLSNLNFTEAVTFEKGIVDTIRLVTIDTQTNNFAKNT